ncbi:MAG: tetratricopeptide repeat protein [Acidobacteria bacterium]|nr:tetratricopeptide repeat protein [Acidobacteriota bacterium]
MRAAALALGMVLLGCSEPRPESWAPESAPLEPDTAAVEIIPRPDLAAFAKPVQRQVAEELEELDRLLADSAAETEDLAERFGRVGSIYHAYGLLEPAEAAYRNAARLGPSDYRWPYLLGVVELTRGESESAERSFSRARDLAPEDVPTILRLGELKLQDDRLAEAADWFRDAMVVEPDSAAALLGLARVDSAVGDHHAAIERLQRVLELEPEAGSVHYLLGLAYQRSGDQEAAARHIALRGVRGVTFDDPLVDGLQDLTSGIGVHFDRGVRALGEGRYQDSVKEYRAALELEPENLTALRGLALALAADGRHEKAAQSFRAMLRVDPGHRLARMELGATLLVSGDLEAAISNFEEAVRVDPDFRQAHFNLAVAHSKAGRWEQGVAALREVLRIDPRDRLGLYEMGAALDKLGRTEDAAIHLRRAVDLYPSLGVARQRLGDVLSRLGDGEGALEQYRAVLDLKAPNQEKGLARYQIGRILTARGADEEAIVEFRKAILLFPELQEARLAIGEALSRQARFGEAADEFERVVRTDGANIHARRRWADVLIRDRQFPAARRTLEEGLAAMPRSGEMAHDLARFLATTPERGLRDGDRALALAEGAYRAEQTLEHAETIAMALAEGDRFEEASKWQRRLIDQAEAGGLADDVSRLRANLERYQDRQPVRRGGG